MEKWGKTMSSWTELMLMTRPGCLASMSAADEGLGEEEGAFEVDVEDGVVVLLGDVPEGGFDLDAGVVDEDVAAAELLVGLVDEVLRVGEDGDVGLDEDGFAAGGFDFGLWCLAPARCGCGSRRRRLRLRWRDGWRWTCPMPEPEPVTIATLPARRPGIMLPPLDDGSILRLIFC